MIESDTLPKGTVLCDRYRVEELIGAGGMGEVYRGVDQVLGRAVALKVISGDHGRRAGLRPHFLNEVRAAAKVNHDHVVKLFDRGTDPGTGRDFYVMELLVGESLKERLDRERFMPPLETAEIVYQAARGLGAGHRLNTWHLDVKPGNLFLVHGDNAQTSLRVLDFGVARVPTGVDETVIHELSAKGLGFSEAYASPEQLRGEDVGPWSDVFSLGVTAYQMLTGERPFRGTDRTRRPRAPRTLVPSVPLGLNDLVLRALEFQPRDRFADGTEFATALWEVIRTHRHNGRDDTTAADETATSAAPPAGHDGLPDPETVRKRRVRARPRRAATSRSGARAYPPLTFVDDYNRSVELHSPVELADALERNPRVGRTFLYKNYIVKKWRDANSGLCAALETLTDERYPLDHDAGFTSAIYLLDPTRPYRGHDLEAGTYTELAQHLLDHSGRFLAGLASPTDRVWLYLETRPDPRVVNGARAHLEVFQQATASGTAVAALHALVVWLRALDGVTWLPLGDIVLRRPVDLCGVEDERCKAAALLLADPASLMSAWVSGSGELPDAAMLDRWRARGALAAELPWVLLGGVRVGDATLRTPADAVSGDSALLRPLWSGDDELRSQASTYLAGYHGEPLVVTAFHWLRDNDLQRAPHLPWVRLYVAEHARTLAGYLALSKPVYDGVVASQMGGGDDAEYALQAAVMSGAEPWRATVDQVLPVVFNSLAAPGEAPGPHRPGGRLVEALAGACSGLLSADGPEGLHSLSSWVSGAVARYRAATRAAEAGWWELFVHVDSSLLWLHREAYWRGDLDPAAMTAAGTSMRHAMDDMRSAGLHFRFNQRFWDEEAAHQVLTAAVDDSIQQVSAADQAKLQREDEKGLAAHRTRSMKDHGVVGLRTPVHSVLIGIVLVLLLGWYLYHYPPLWHVFDGMVSAPSPTLAEPNTEWWRRLNGELHSSSTAIVWSFLLGLAPVFPLSALGLWRIVIATRHDYSSSLLPSLFWTTICFLWVLMVLSWGPLSAAVLGLLYPSVLTVLIVWWWWRALTTHIKDARAMAAVPMSKAYVDECNERRVEAAAQRTARRTALLLEARRSLALADDPADVLAPKAEALHWPT